MSVRKSLTGKESEMVPAIFRIYPGSDNVQEEMGKADILKP